MLGEIASSRFGFWVVAAVLAAADSTFLLKPGKFAFSVSSTNQVRIRISQSPFTLRNSELAVSLLSFPFQTFFVSDVDASSLPAQQTLKALSHLRRFSRQNNIFSALAMLAATSLVLGPCIAALMGIQRSIILLFPPLYLLAITASVLLWQRRRRLSFSKVIALKICAEIILCPVLIVNLSKRISLAQTSKLNTFELVPFTTFPDHTLHAIRENLSHHNGD
jgi:hypothetical protein